jgi:hypothetical protein
MNTQKKIFLSHSGFDATLAISLASRFRSELGVEVFCTSEPEYRYAHGATFGGPTDCDRQLMEYLSTHLGDCSVYFLLATPRSVKANSPWIVKEMFFADYRAQLDPYVKFVACGSDGLSARELPEVARKRQWAVLEDNSESLDYLVESLRRCLDDVTPGAE